jgi:exopolysaccharide production protein ExoQ
MRKVFNPLHATQAPPATPQAPPPRRTIGSTLRKAAGQAYLTPLLILLYLIFYANLPDKVNDFSFKPFVTAGTIDRIVKIAAILFSLIVITSKWSLLRRVMKDINPGLIACMVLIVMSAAWSYDSNATLLRFTTLLGIVLLCMAIPLAGWHPRRFQQVVMPPMMFTMIVSLLVGLIAPTAVKEIGDDISLANAWRGVTFQKNQFGMTASIATVLCAHRWLTAGRFSPWNIIAVIIALTCMALSRSSTSLIATMLALTFMLVVMKVPIIKQRFTGLVVIGLFSLILIYELAIQNLIPGVYTLLRPVMELTGKDMTFSARSTIWEIVKEHSAAAPWLGTGYGAFWTSETPDSPSYVFVWRMSFWPSTSHNGYLEILNDLGRVGLLCLLAFLVWYVRQALQLMQFDRNQAVLFLCILYLQMVANLSESEWFSRSTTNSILILASLCLSRALTEHRHNARQQASAPRRA